MKCGMIKKGIVLVLMASFAQISWASDSTYINVKKISEEDPQNTNSVITTVQVIRRVASFWALSGSNGIPLNIASKFITGGYISPDQMTKIESSLPSNNRLGYLQDMSVTIYPLMGVTQPQKNLALNNISIGTLSLGGISFTKDAFGVLFRGNTPYLGERKELGQNQFVQLRQRYVDFDFNIPKNIGSWRFSANIKLSQVLDYQKSETNDLFVETDPNADSVKLGGRFYSLQTGYDFWGTGVGLQGGISTFHGIGNGAYLSFSISDFGVLSFSQVNRQSRGYEWENESLNPIKDIPINDVTLQSVGLTGTDLKVSNWFDRQRDTIESRLNIQDGVQRGTVWAPFRASLSYFKMSRNYSRLWQGYRVNLQYIHINGFIPRLNTELFWRFRNVRFNTGISLGGFDTFDLNASAEFEAGMFQGKGLNWGLFLRGIESFIVPSQFHGGGVGIELSYPFGG